MSPTRAPGAAWRAMVAGNERFIAGAPDHPRQDVDRRERLMNGQTPRAALFGCSDSRLAAEIIFDMGLGDLFVIRNIGQIISNSVVGSLEYAVAVLRVPLIVVLGHDACGAVRAAIDSQGPEPAALPPHVAGLVDDIVPAVDRVAGATRPIDPDQVDASAVGRMHLRNTIGELLQVSELISDGVAAGTLGVVGANYRLLEGRVAPDVALGLDVAQR